MSDKVEKEVRSTMVRLEEHKAARLDGIADRVGLRLVDLYRMAIDSLLEEVARTGKLPHATIETEEGVK